ncbi:MAG: PQQ-binding-like beta-propeller repeat protein, partial [Deltaproteobacteria bacterium]|nr:PQQ-binding-like beta-propeller repeat protein [Deltaproteobacteria bacterium]
MPTFASAAEDWERTLGSAITAADTDEYGNLIVVGTEDGWVYAYNPDGDVLWSRQVDDPYGPRPVDKIIVSQDGSRYMLMVGRGSEYPGRFEYCDGITGEVLSATIPMGRRLHLPFDEGSGSTVYDQSLYGNDGTIYGATWTRGRYGYALSFDGVDDDVNAGTVLNFSGKQPFTIVVWIKPEYGDATYPGVVVKEAFSPSRNGIELLIGRNGEYIAFNRWVDGSAAQIKASIIWDEWQFVVVTYDG